VLLDGIRVLDFTQYLAGPSATRMLAALGADVVKIEFAPDGDPSRLLPVIRDGRSAYYVQQNRGKRSVAVDLGRPEGVELVRRLVAHCDVVTENFGPGVLERRGLDHATLSGAHPALITASISAFGKTGPLAHLPGYDLMGQALSGMMYLTGEPDGPPQFTGSPIADCSAGQLLFGAIGHALFHRERTGRGQRIEVSLVDSVFHMHSIAVQGHTVTGGEFHQERAGRQFRATIPSGTYRGPQGWIVLQVLDRQWERFCAAIGRADLEHDDRFSTVGARVANADDLIEIIEAWMATFETDAAVLDHLHAHRCPAAPVLDPVEAVDHPHFRERAMVRTVDDAVLGPFVVPGLPVKFGERTEPDDEPAAPLLGEHNAEVYGNLGLSTADIEKLHGAGVI
jgi:crotonobetainyl-CoA:carnitine CoA-transferase CaiB-like acyl-CoA transferase